MSGREREIERERVASVEASSQVEPMLPGSSHSSALIQTRNQLGITPPAPAPVSCAAVYGAACTALRCANGGCIFSAYCAAALRTARGDSIQWLSMCSNETQSVSMKLNLYHI